MKTWVKVLIITLIFGIPAFFLGPILWTPHPDIRPSQFQLPFFILLSAIEALAFGIGIAFICLGWPLVRNAAPQMKGRAMAFYLSVSWLLVSWWPHDNFHVHNGLNLAGLLMIDYGFHVTLIIASLALAYNLFLTFKGYQKSAKSKSA